MDKEVKNYKGFEMHVDFFNHVKDAIDSGFYYEAIFFEYAAIESRLEVLCGLLDYPCNRELNDDFRRRININQRIQCLKNYYRRNSIETKRSKTKMSASEWKKLEGWIKTKRNPYVHGLFKKPELYMKRLYNSKEVAMEGYKLANQLYQEVNRVKGIFSRKTQLIMTVNLLCTRKCFNDE